MSDTGHVRSNLGPGGRWSGWREQVGLVGVLLACGVLVALVWRLLTPTTATLGDEQEAAAAVDGTLALIGLGAGTLTAAFVLVRPGRAPLWRTLAATLGSLLGAVVSWRLGDLLGTPALRALGAVLSWPVATATVIFLGALLPGTSARLQSPAPARDPGPDEADWYTGPDRAPEAGPDTPFTLAPPATGPGPAGRTGP